MARYAPLVPLVAGAVLLIVAEFVTVREIIAVTVVPPGGTETGGGLHGYALGLIGVAVLVMSYGAVVRGARPAAVALLVLALAACAIVLFVDLPVLDDEGLIGRTYEPRRGAAGDRLLPREPGRGAGAGGRDRLARADAAGNPGAPPAHYLTRRPMTAVSWRTRRRRRVSRP